MSVPNVSNGLRLLTGPKGHDKATGVLASKYKRLAKRIERQNGSAIRKFFWSGVRQIPRPTIPHILRNSKKTAPAKLLDFKRGATSTPAKPKTPIQGDKSQRNKNPEVLEKNLSGKKKEQSLGSVEEETARNGRKTNTVSARNEAQGKTHREILDRKSNQESVESRFDESDAVSIRRAVNLEFPDVARLVSDNNDLENERERFTKLLIGLRQQEGVAPKKRVKVTGAFLRAIARSTLMPGADEKDLTQKALKQMKMGCVLLSYISKGGIEMDRALIKINTDLPEVRAVIAQQRKSYYLDLATTRFVHNFENQLIKELKQEYEKSPGGGLLNYKHYELKKLLHSDDLKEKFDKYLAWAKGVAKAKEDYEDQRDRVARVLGKKGLQEVEKALRIAKHGIRIIDLSGIDEDANGTEPKNNEFLSQERTSKIVKELSGGKESGAFQIVRLLECQKKYQKKKSVKALYDFEKEEEKPHIDSKESGRNGVGNRASNDLKEEKRLKEFFGAIAGRKKNVKDELEKLGYNRDVIEVKKIVGLAEKGLSGPGDLISVQERFKKTNYIFRDKTIQKGARSQLHKNTNALAKQIYYKVRTDAQRLYDETYGSGHHGATESERADRGLRGVNSAITRALFGGSDQDGSNLFRDALEEEKKLYLFRRDKKEKLLTQRTTIKDRVSKNEKILNTSIKALYKKLKESEPEKAKKIIAVSQLNTKDGLDCAKLIVKALKLNEKSNGADANKKNELDKVLKSLANYDLKTFQGSSAWYDRLPSRLTKRIHGLNADFIEELRDADIGKAARALVFLKDEAPREEKRLQREVDKLALEQVKALRRRASSAPGMFNAVYRIIHAAVIENMSGDQRTDPQEARLNATYNVKGIRSEILNTLTLWGMNVKEFEAEIDHVLGDVVDGKNLSPVKKDIDNHDFSELLNFDEQQQHFSSKLAGELPFLRQGYSRNVPTPSKEKKEVQSFGKSASNYWMHRREITNVIREDFRALFSELRPGEKYDFAAGFEYGFNSRKLPLDSATVSRIRGRVSMAVQNRMRVEVGEDGSYKICGIGEQNLGTRGDIEIAPSLLGDPENRVVKYLSPYLRLGFKAELQLNHARGKGYSITFPPGEEGKAAAIELVMSAIDQEKPSAHVFELADYITTFLGKTTKTSQKIGGFSLIGGSMKWGNLVDRDERKIATGSVDKQELGSDGFAGIKRERITKVDEHEDVDKKVIETEGVTDWSLEEGLGWYFHFWSVPGYVMSKVMEEIGFRQFMDDSFNNKGVVPEEEARGLWDGARAQMLTNDVIRRFIKSKYKTINKRKIEYKKTGINREILTSSQISATTILSGKRTLAAIIGEIKGEDNTNWELLCSKEKEVSNLFKLEKLPELKNAKFEVFYRLSPGKISEYNEFISEAIHHREVNEIKKAKKLEHEAKLLLRDRKNYILDSISMLQTNAYSASKFRGTATLAHRKRLGEMTATRTVAKIKF